MCVITMIAHIYSFPIFMLPFDSSLSFSVFLSLILLDFLLLLFIILVPLPKMFSYTILMICSCFRLSLDGLSREQLFKLLSYFFPLLSPTFLRFYDFSLSLSLILYLPHQSYFSLSLVVLVIPPSLDLRIPSIFLTREISPFVSSRFYNFASLCARLHFSYLHPLCSGFRHGTIDRICHVLYSRDMVI